MIMWAIVFATTFLSAQDNVSFTVNAGEKVENCIPISESYRFVEFTEGIVFFRNGSYAKPKLNYNLLNGEMEYLDINDTLSISNPESIMLIAIVSDTFYYDQGYLEVIFSGNLKVAKKQYFELKQVQKKDSYGSSGSNSATDSYSSIETISDTYKLVTNQDRTFEKKVKYYLTSSYDEFVSFNKKKVMQLFPQNKDAIQNYIKSEKINFESESDLLKFAAFLQNL